MSPTCVCITCGAFSQQLRPGSPSRPSVASVTRPLAPRCSCGTSQGRNGSSLGFGEPDSYSLPPPGVRRTFRVPTEGRVRGAGEDAVGRRKEEEGAAPGSGPGEGAAARTWRQLAVARPPSLSPGPTAVGDRRLHFVGGE